MAARMGKLQQIWLAQKGSVSPTKTGKVKSECLEKTPVRGSEHPPARNNENSHLLAQSKVDAALSFQTPQRMSREDLSRANGDESFGSQLTPTQQLDQRLREVESVLTPRQPR